MKIIIYTLIILSLNYDMTGQFQKTVSCSNPAFDKKVDSYLSYDVPVLSVADAYKMKSEIVFLDAREYDEYEVSHIPAARFVGYKSFNIALLKDIPKEKNIVVYCSIGYRSEKIGAKLIKSGYTNVHNLYGSLFEWVNHGYEVTDKNGNNTSQIHTYNKSWSQWISNSDIKKIW